MTATCPRCQTELTVSPGTNICSVCTLEFNAVPEPPPQIDSGILFQGGGFTVTREFLHFGATSYAIGKMSSVSLGLLPPPSDLLTLATLIVLAVAATPFFIGWWSAIAIAIGIFLAWLCFRAHNRRQFSGLVQWVNTAGQTQSIRFDDAEVARGVRDALLVAMSGH